MNPEQPQFTPENNLTQENAEAFRKLIEGWRRNADGEDYCPDCWPKKVEKLQREDPEFLKIYLEYSKPADVGSMRIHRASDGWFIGCTDCEKSIAYPPSQKTELT